MSNRFVVTEPIPGGYAWWRVADTQNQQEPNAEVFEVFRDEPAAKEIIEALAHALNHDERFARAMERRWNLAGPVKIGRPVEVTA